MLFRVTLSMRMGFYANTGTTVFLEGVDYVVRGDRLVLLDKGSVCYRGKSKAARKVRRMLLEGRIPRCESNTAYSMFGSPCPILAYNPVTVPEPYEVTLLILSALYWKRIYRNPELLKRHLRVYTVGSCSLVQSHWWRILRELGLRCDTRLAGSETREVGAAPVLQVSRVGVSPRRLRCHLGSTGFTATYIVKLNVGYDELLSAVELYSRAQLETSKEIRSRLRLKPLYVAEADLVVRIGALAWPLNSISVLAYHEGIITGALFEKVIETRKRCGYSMDYSSVYAAYMEPVGLLEPGWVKIEEITPIHG